MYLGMLLILISISFRFNFYGGILIDGFFVYFITYFQILPEEKAMLEIFGDDFINYKNKEDGYKAPVIYIKYLYIRQKATI